jgi:acyl carrier protein
VNDIQPRLTRCFSAVFPRLPEPHIASATLETVAGWDSVAAATLVTTIEEEFGMEFDADVLGDLTSYQSIFNYLTALPARES